MSAAGSMAGDGTGARVPDSPPGSGVVGAPGSEVDDDAAETKSALSLQFSPLRPLWQRLAGQWPLGLVLIGLGAGLAAVALSYWRKGTFLMGLAVVFGGLSRACVSDKTAGLLAVRSKWIDTILMLVLGIGICVLSLVVPPYRRNP